MESVDSYRLIAEEIKTRFLQPNTITFTVQAQIVLISGIMQLLE